MSRLSKLDQAIDMRTGVVGTLYVLLTLHKKERDAARNQRMHYWEEQVNMNITCLLR